MELEKQVCSFELAKRLKELRVKQESFYLWDGVDRDLHRSDDDQWLIDRCYSAFTVAELGEMLPKNCRTRRSIDHKDDWLVDSLSTDHMAHSPTEADARANMLIYLLENGLILEVSDGRQDGHALARR